MAGTLGFGFGIIFLAGQVSSWFFFLLVLPLVLYRGLVLLLLDLTIRSTKPVDVLVDDVTLDVLNDNERLTLPLVGIIQVFRSGSDWTVLHLDGSEIIIPATAITTEQIEYLKSFALRAAAERKAESET